MTNPEVLDPNAVAAATDVVLRPETAPYAICMENAGYGTSVGSESCTGTADDVAINTCITRKESNEYIFMPGVYDITAPINCFAGMKLVGSCQGKGGVLSGDSSQVVFKAGTGLTGTLLSLVSNPDVTVENIVFDLDGNADLSAVVADGNSPGFTAINCQVRNMGAGNVGIELNSDGKVEGCTFTSYQASEATTVIPANSVGVMAKKGMAMENCKFANLARAVETDETTGVVGYLKENTMDNCTVGVLLKGQGYNVDHCTMNACGTGVQLAGTARYNAVTNNCINNANPNSILLQSGATLNFVEHTLGVNWKAIDNKSGNKNNIVINRYASSEIGNFEKKASVITDWNAAITSGTYMATGAANAPLPNKWFIGLTLRHNDERVVQRVYSFVDDHKWYERYSLPGSVKNQPVFSDWVEDVAITRTEKTAIDGHLTDADKHVTAAEKTAWNGKAAASHTHDDRYYTGTEMDGKLAAKAASDHTHTAADVGAVPTTRKINNKILNADVTLAAADVNAAAAVHTHIQTEVTGLADALADKAASDHTHTAADVGAVPTTRKINNKVLNADVTLAAADVNAAAAIHTHTQTEVNGLANALADKAEADHTHTAADVGAVPATRKINNKVLSADVTLAAADVNAAAAIHTHDDRYYTEIEVDGKLADKAASDHTHTAADVGAVPITRKINNKILSADVTLAAADVNAAAAIHNHDAAYDTKGAAATVQTALNTHTGNTTVHISAAERTAWNAKADKTYVDGLVGNVEASLAAL